MLSWIVSRNVPRRSRSSWIRCKVWLYVMPLSVGLLNADQGLMVPWNKCTVHTHRACSSVALAGFALPECPGSSSRVYPALEGLTSVVNSCDLFRPRPGFDPLCVRLSPPRYLTCSWACRMSSGPWGLVVVRVSWPGHPTSMCTFFNN